MSSPSLIHQYQAFLQCPSLWVPAKAPLPYFSFPNVDSTSNFETLDLPKNVVFGRKMESFFSHAITHSSRYDLLAENVQIISNKVTLGELDFLLKHTETQQLIHVELACKFYLYDPYRKGNNEYCHWVGPNRNDFLDRKIEKLKDKQLPLLQHPECQKLLRPIIGSGSNTIAQQVHFPAYLFLPFNHKHVPDNVNRKAIKGFWLKPEQLQNSSFEHAQYHLPPKTHWLISPHHNANWVSQKVALTQINEMHSRKKSPLVWVKYPDESYHRLFVVWW